MILLQDTTVRLRAMEPGDCETLYRWENDTRLWSLGDTTRPFSREVLQGFIDASGSDMYAARQLRLMIQPVGDGSADASSAVGCVDLFAFDPLRRRAGVGILIYEDGDRRRGYALAALRLAAEYAFGHLEMRQLWAEIPVSNTASLRLFEKAGFSGEAVKRQWVRTAGEPGDGESEYEDARFVQLFRSR